MPKVILVYNYKGGIGKSTISSNLAAGLAKIGAKVLLTNVDGQNNSLNFLKEGLKHTTSIYDLLKPERMQLSEAKVELGPNLDGLSSKNMQDVNVILTLNREHLKECFNVMFPAEEIKEYDYLIFDCGPQESMLNSMLMLNATGLILPIQAEYSGVEATVLTFEYLESLGLSKDIIKIAVPNMVEKNTGSKIALKSISTMLPADKITEPIPRRAAIGYAGTCSNSIFDFTTESTILEPFFNLIEKAVQIFNEQ